MLTGLSPLFSFSFFSFFLIFLIFIRTSAKEGKGKGVPLQRVTPLMTSQRLVNLFEYKSHLGTMITSSRLTETVKPGFHMIVTIVAIAKNGCDDPDDHMETPIFFSVTIVTIRIATVVKIEFDRHDRRDRTRFY